MELSLKRISSEHALRFCVLYNKHCLITAEQMSNNMIRLCNCRTTANKYLNIFTAAIMDFFPIFFWGSPLSPSYTVLIKNNLQSAPDTSFSETGVAPAAGWPSVCTGLFLADRCPALWKGWAMPPFYFRVSFCTPDTAEEKKPIHVTSHF